MRKIRWLGNKFWKTGVNGKIQRILSLTESPALLRQKNMRNHKWRLVVVADPAESDPGRQSRRFLMSGRQSSASPKLLKSWTSGNKLQLFPILQRISHSPKDIQLRKSIRTFWSIWLNYDIYLCFPSWTNVILGVPASSPAHHDVIYILIHTN